MKRSELKQLLKECLLEILTEEPSVKRKLQEAVVNKPSSKSNVNAKEIARQMAGADEFEAQNEAMLMEQINAMAIGAAGGNRKQAELMKSIFADTALNTLPAQKEIAPGVAAGSAMGDMNNPGIDLGSLSMDGDMTRWASVAFNGKK